MINYLSWEDIEEINKLVLKHAEKGEHFGINNVLFLLAVTDFVKNNFKDDIFKKATGYCVALIVLHPFTEGNHRTSLTTSDAFLNINGFYTEVLDDEIKQLQEWRLKYGMENELERKFFSISNIVNIKERNEEIKNIMKSEYGNGIENWLRKNYKVKTNELLRNI